jgi:hypothetical protein
MKKPRIYGSEARFRAALTRSVRIGEELLDQTEGVRRRMQLVGESRMDALAVEEAWERDFRRWFNGTGRALAKYLQEQLVGVPKGLRPDPNAEGEDLLPVLGAGLPPDDGKLRHTIGIDNGEVWLSKTLDELRELQSALGQPNAPARPASERSRDSFFTKPVWLALGVVGSVASIVGVVLAIIALWH